MRTPLTMKGPTLSRLALFWAHALTCTRVIPPPPPCLPKESSAEQPGRCSLKEPLPITAEGTLHRAKRMLRDGRLVPQVVNHSRGEGQDQPKRWAESGDGQDQPGRWAESHAVAMGPLALRHETDSQGRIAAQAWRSPTGSKLPFPWSRSWKARQTRDRCIQHGVTLQDMLQRPRLAPTAGGQLTNRKSLQVQHLLRRGPHKLDAVE